MKSTSKKGSQKSSQKNRSRPLRNRRATNYVDKILRRAKPTDS